MFLGGDQSMICIEEVRRCYLDGSYMAVVLLCLAYVERELAAHLYAAGWENAKKARLSAILKRAYEYGMLSQVEWQTYCELNSLRNSHAHFRSPGSPTSMMARTAEENVLPREMLAEDARKAILAMARFVKRQTGIKNRTMTAYLCDAGTHRHNVGTATKSCATSRGGLSLINSYFAAAILESSIFRLRPPARPCRRAAPFPARVCSIVRSRSICARLAMTWKKNRPAVVDVSI